MSAVLHSRCRLGWYYHQRLAEWGNAAAEGSEEVDRRLSELDQDLGQIRHVFDGCRAATDRDDDAAAVCIELAAAGVEYLDLRLHPGEALAWHQTALACARRLGEGVAQALHSGYVGTAYIRLGEPQHALDYLDQARELLEGEGDPEGDLPTILLEWG
ncbi:MAG TPA: tetratricopeptide repeat protein, partial [Urbifossiella sp.]|nr:tetratricopeptide repeat protein [Urbifossiella sp.]